MSPRRLRKLTCAQVLCVAAAAGGCAPQRYTYYEPTTANARFAPGHGCTGPHDLVIFPPEKGGVQVGIVVNERGSTQELWFDLRNDFEPTGFITTDEWRKRYLSMLAHVFDVYSPSPDLTVSFVDGTTASLRIPYLENLEHRRYVAGKIEGVPSRLVKWPLPTKAVDGFDVLLPPIFVDGKLIPTSPIHFARTTKVIVEGINC